MRKTTGALALILGAASIVHALAPGIYRGIVPAWVPGTRQQVVAVSGVAEGLTAAGLLYPPTRRAAGWAAAALLIAILPANIEMARKMRTPRSQILAWARVPLQIPLVMWAVRAGSAKD